ASAVEPATAPDPIALEKPTTADELDVGANSEALPEAPSAPTPTTPSLEEAPKTIDPPTPPIVDPTAHRWTFAAVPTLTFNTDEGFGTGGVISLYHHHEGVSPFRNELRFNIFISSKLIQAHAITWDGIKPFGLPGRVYARLRYFSTVSQNYCGVGNVVDCDPADAKNAATARGFVDDESRSDDAYDTFTRRYYLMRFIRPEATLLYRHWLRDKPLRTEILVGWRGSYTLPGDVANRGPYPGSRYAQDFPVGEEGLSSVPMVGVVVDDRDDEVFPMRGFVSELSVRGAHAFTGSAFQYGAINAQSAFFFALSSAPRVVLATRFIADVMVGAPSTEELARIGGTIDSIAFGGSAIGRGIREHRYLGKLKFINQTELRAQLLDVNVLEQDLSFGTAVFSDSAIIGYDVSDFRGNPFQPLATVGVSARVIWNKTFAVRADLATSPNEKAGPGFYIIVGQAF
ncbi:MAG TPA: BamA/TamA family outer membrane protein, partial [Myxococcota bacterium]